MVSVDEKINADNDDEETESAVDDIVAHLIQIHDRKSDRESPHADLSKQSFSHMTPSEDSKASAAFTAALQNHAFIHATI